MTFAALALVTAALHQTVHPAVSEDPPRAAMRPAVHPAEKLLVQTAARPADAAAVAQEAGAVEPAAELAATHEVEEAILVPLALVAVAWERHLWHLQGSIEVHPKRCPCLQVLRSRLQGPSSV